jgi:hypothetical protein
MMKKCVELFAVAHPDDTEVMLGNAVGESASAWVSIATLGELGIDMLDPVNRRFCPGRI